MARIAANPGSFWLILGGILSLIAALLHVAVIIGGPAWYRFFGAGEELAQAAARGEIMPHLITAGIALVLAIWAGFAFSGAGRLSRFPLLRTGLVVISAIYLVRGLIVIPLLVLRPDAVDGFTLWSSIIVLAYGLAYGSGTWLAWSAMRPGNHDA